MRRAVLLVVVVAVGVLALAGGMVLAETKTCPSFECVGTRGADTLTGNGAQQDRIAGLEGNDQIDGMGGSDTLYGDEGNDTIRDDSGALDADTVYGDEGNDTIHVNEFNGAAAGDTINCGPGTKDRVFFDKGIDTIHKSCEIRRPAQQ
jgi:Ca2+-binding RTX toxin-like protein